MKKRIPIYLLACLILVQAIRAQTGFRDDYFRAPVDLEMLLSGNFGELRSNHFHAGIDIKTGGVTGHNIYACAEGYISRIKIEAAGYGNTLYITHPEGYTTVYAHLDRFRKDIADFVRSEQYSKQQHALNIFPEKEKFPVSRGEMIAFSGTSGYSFGPHLHFEIRDAGNQEPMNALLFGLDIEDIIPPRIFSLYVYPDGQDGIVNHSRKKTRLEVGGKNGNYHLAAGDTIHANGRLGFGIEAFDYLNGAHNRCGIYRIRIYIDGIQRYAWEMNRFPFSKARMINSYIDYEERTRNKKVVQKTFIDPNNNLDLYQYVEGDGMLDFSESRSYLVKCILEDAYENRSELEFLVRGGSPAKTPLIKEVNEGYQEFNCREENELSLDDIILNMPRGALYKDLNFRYETKKKMEGTFSALHCLHDPYTPVHLASELRIRPDGLPPSLQDKALIASLDENDDINPAGGEWQDGFVVTQIREFGNYFVLIDTLAPEIESLDLNGSADTISKNSIRFKVTDTSSGIKSYEGYIDNDWVLFEYDAKNDIVFYRFDPERLAGDRDHELELYIIDNKDNIAYYYAEFYW